MNKTQQLIEALKPFASFYTWLKALESMGDIDKLDDHTVIIQSMGGGGSVRLYVQDFSTAWETIKEALTPPPIDYSYTEITAVNAVNAIEKEARIIFQFIDLASPDCRCEGWEERVNTSLDIIEDYIKGLRQYVNRPDRDKGEIDG